MAREIQVLTWCDPCQGRGERTPATVTRTALDENGKPKMLDLCEVDDKGLFSELYAMLSEFGVAPEANGAAPLSNDRPHRCPAPGCTNVPFKTRGGMRNHFEKAHPELTLSVVEGMTPMERRTGEYPCDVCDFVAKAAQGLGAHKSRVHGIAGVSANKG